MTIEKVTMEQIEGLIEREDYTVFETTTTCFLTLKGGFRVSGESACMNPEDYNKELGEKIARGRAINEIWALEGYYRMRSAAA